jgi:hypothetical protein
MDPLSADDTTLLQRAGAHGFPALEQLTSEAVQQLTQEHGVDFATAVLFDRLCKAPQHAEFIASVQAAMAAPATSLPARDWKIAIVPGALYLERPDLGGDGKIVREAAAAFGVKNMLVPLASRGSVTENAERLANWLLQRPDEKLVLVSLSKGSTDLKRALARPDAAEAFRNVVAWVNVCGPMDGTQMANWLLDNRFRAALLKLQYRLQRRDLAFITELRRDHHPAAVTLIPGLPLLSLIGFPLQRHLTARLSRFCHGIISRLGPNDGTVLLTDAIQWPGEIFPVWGADHYFRPESTARALLHAVLSILTERLSHPPA